MELRQLLQNFYENMTTEDFHRLRWDAFETAKDLYEERAASLNVDLPPYEELIYGPISGATEIFKRAKRLASILTPLREKELTVGDVNRALDLCIDMLNYVSWEYAMLRIASGLEGNPGSDDAPEYFERRLRRE